MKNKIIGYLNNGLLVVGAVIAVYVLADIYILKRNLPSGVCPVVNNRPLIYTAMALCIASFILSFFEHKDIKKEES